MLVYTVMAGINAFRSRRDGKKVKASLARKHEAGGSMGPARIGYLNGREIAGGREVAIITVDEDRVELVQQAFDLFATGEHTITTITDLLEDMGLRTRPSPKRPSKPMSRSMVHRMLSDDYYIGIVTLNGVKHEGRHEAIIDPEIFEQVQQILRAHKTSGDRSHKHRHYLVGSLHCKVCTCRLGYGRHRGNGGVYEYFSCLSPRRRRRRGRKRQTRTRRSNRKKTSTNSKTAPDTSGANSLAAAEAACQNKEETTGRHTGRSRRIPRVARPEKNSKRHWKTSNKASRYANKSVRTKARRKNIENNLKEKANCANRSKNG